MGSVSKCANPKKEKGKKENPGKNKTENDNKYKRKQQKILTPREESCTGEGVQFLNLHQEDWELINTHIIKNYKYWRQEYPQVKARTPPNLLMARAEPLETATPRNENLEFLVGTGTNYPGLIILQGNFSDASIPIVGATGTPELCPFFKPMKLKLGKL